MLIYLPVTSRPLIVLEKEAVSSPCNFATAHLTACILNCYLPRTSRPMKRRTLSQRPITITPHELFLVIPCVFVSAKEVLGELILNCIPTLTLPKWLQIN